MENSEIGKYARYFGLSLAIRSVQKIQSVVEELSAKIENKISRPLAAS